MSVGKAAAPAVCLTLALAAASCSAPGFPSFMVGIFGVDDPTALAGLRENGFNAVQTYRSDLQTVSALERAVRRRGMTLLAQPQDVMKNSAGSAYRSTVWYLADEPDVNGITPAAMKELDERVRRWSPEVPTAFVVGDGHAAARYARSGDFLMVDWYPVPHLPLESLGDHVALTVAAAKNKPVWAVIQAMNWKDYPQKDPRKPRIGRFPSMAEIRFMSYDAVYNGARGLWYFAYGRPDGSVLSDTPEEWFALTEVTREMAAMRPIFIGGTPIALPFQPEPDGVATRGWHYHGRDYVVLLNRWPKAMPVPKVMLEERWRPLFSPRRDVKELLAQRDGVYYLQPYDVLVFESRLWPFN